MNIVVYTSFLIFESDERKIFLSELLSELASRQKEHCIYLLTKTKTDAGSYTLLPNVIPVPCRLPAPNTFLKKFLWKKVTLPGLLKKINPDIFLSIGVPCAVSFPQPQVVVILSDREKLSTRQLKKASVIAVHTSEQKKKLGIQLPDCELKTEIVPAAVSKIYHPLPEKEKEEIKMTFSRSKEFFLCPCKHAAYDTLLCLLQAFSRFKKRQQSSMKLVLLGPTDKKLNTRIATYKYRNDVIMLQDLSPVNEAALLASSYAVLQLPDDPEPLLTTLKTLHSSVPLLAPNKEQIKEMAGPAALYFQINEEKSWAEAMMRIYTDENLKAELITRGNTLASHFTIQKLVAGLLNCLKKAIT